VGRPLTIALVAAASAAHADPDVRVAAACDAVIDPATVIVALRVELRDGTEAVYVDCPAGDGVVVALGDRRTAVPLEDVDPPERARVVALAVAEQLRPPSEPATAVATILHAEPPRPYELPRWSLAARLDGVAAKKANAGVASVVLARRLGRIHVEAALGGVLGSSDAGRIAGATGELRVVAIAYRTVRTELGVAAGLMFVGSATDTAAGWEQERAVAGRGELRVEFALGDSSWRGIAAAGAGRALSGDAAWFGVIALGAAHGL
jgi:hypothetical protein